MRFLCLVFGVAVFASDDQSLMQQNLGIETASTAQSLEEHKAVVNEIGEAVSKLSFPGKMRQMALDSLMKELAATSASPAEPTNAELYAEILSLFAGIVAEFTSTRDTQNIALSDINDLIDACNVAGHDNDITVDTAWDTAKNVHSENRMWESHNRTEYEGLCLTMTNEMATADVGTGSYGGALNCHFWTVIAALADITDSRSNTYKDTADINTKLISEFANFNTGFGAIDTWFTHAASAGGLYPTIDPCDTAIQNFETARTNANTQQGNGEMAYCVHRKTRLDRCTLLDECFLNETTSGDALITTYLAAAVVRMFEGDLLLHMTCLVTELAADRHDTSVCSNVPLNADVISQFNITVDPHHAKYNCVITGVQDVPTASSWISTHYASCADLSFLYSDIPCIPTNAVPPVTSQDCSSHVPN